MWAHGPFNSSLLPTPHILLGAPLSGPLWVGGARLGSPMVLGVELQVTVRKAAHLPGHTRVSWPGRGRFQRLLSWGRSGPCCLENRGPKGAHVWPTCHAQGPQDSSAPAPSTGHTAPWPGGCPGVLPLRLGHRNQVCAA